MGLADWIYLAILLLSAAVGALIGFGKGLKLMTGGIVGLAIAAFLCYCFGGMILDIPFVTQMMKDLASHWAGNAILTAMHLELIIYYIVLFIIALILKKILTMVIQGIMETDNTVMKVLNKTFGAVLMAAFALLLTLLVFQIIALVGPASTASFERILSINGGNAILINLFLHNPMASVVGLVG